MIPSQYLTRWSDLPEQATGPGVTRRRLAGAGMDLTLVQIAAGIAAPRHSHDHEQFVQVITGTGMLETAAGRQRFGPGCLFHFPKGTWHAAEFETDTTLVETSLAAGKSDIRSD